MAGKIAGADVLLKVAGTDGNMIVIAGQTGTTLNMSADTIDVTDKTSGGWKTSLPGLREWSIDQDVFYTVGDESNKLLLNAFLERTKIKAAIRVGADEDEDGVSFEGDVYITDFPLDFSVDDAASVSMSLAGASALKVTQGAAPVAP